MNEIAPQDRPIHGPVNAAGDGQVVAEVRAKQGRRGRHILVVLVVSTVMAVVAVFAIWGINARSLASHTQRPVASAATDQAR